MDREPSASSVASHSSTASLEACLVHLQSRLTAAQEDIAALRASLFEAQASVAELRQDQRQVQTRLRWLEHLFGALRRALQSFLTAPPPPELV